MSVNSSNDSSSCFDPRWKLQLITECLVFPPGSDIFVSYCVTNVLLLCPLCVLMLHHILQQWRRQTAVSHSDSYTYQSAFMELIQVLSSILGFFGVHMCQPNLVVCGYAFLGMVWLGELLLHLLTCVERYLAVVHPVTYLGLRNERGTRIRNITIACTWPLSLLMMTFLSNNRLVMILNFVLWVLSLALVSFCSLSVLQVLIRPRPGDQEGGNKERLDQSKRRAFSIIVTILGVLGLRFSVGLAWVVLFLSGRQNDCVLMVCGLWCSLPSSLVLPLLFVLKKRNVL